MITNDASFFDILEGRNKSESNASLVVGNLLKRLLNIEPKNIDPDITELDKLARHSVDSGISRITLNELQSEIASIISK